MVFVRYLLVPIVVTAHPDTPRPILHWPLAGNQLPLFSACPMPPHHQQLSEDRRRSLALGRSVIAGAR